MTLQEFKDIFPQSRLTPQSITDMYNDLSGVRQDVTKFRLVTFGSARLMGNTLPVGANQVVVILNVVGTGQLILDAAALIDIPRGELTDCVSIEVSESGVNLLIVQYALFTWD